MEIRYSQKALDDRSFWIKSGNKKLHKKISELITSIESTPYTGTGKPELLKHELTGYWSRRINSEHRIVYNVDEENNIVNIHSLKGHYK